MDFTYNSIIQNIKNVMIRASSYRQGIREWDSKAEKSHYPLR